MGYRIASFNMKNLSYSDSGKCARDLDFIANFILEHEIDIVAMQEVLSDGKALTGIRLNNPSGEAKAYEYSLLMRLGGSKEWGIQWGAPQDRKKDIQGSDGDKRGEGYAFLWRKKRISLPLNKNGMEILPKIFDDANYRVLEASEQKRLIRNPFYGRFVPKELPETEIRLINTHIIFGTTNSGALRQKEFEILAGQIYPRVSEYRRDIHATSPYTIILGDYNLNLKSSGQTPVVEDVVCFNAWGRKIPVSDSAYTSVYTVQNELTTLKAKEDGLSSNYDHFSFDKRVRDNIVKGVSVYKIPESLAESAERSKFTVYREKVSDHVPIIIDIDFR